MQSPGKTKATGLKPNLHIRTAGCLKGILIFSVIQLIAGSCKKMVEIPAPVNLIAENSVYNNDATSIAVLTGIYTNMGYAGADFPFTGNNSISLFAGLSADELSLYNGVTSISHVGYYKNAHTVNLTTGSGYEAWSPIYNNVYKCNAAIEGLTASASLTPVVKQQLLGEARFMRGFFYFYLANLFGDVPLAITTDYKVNSLLPRAPETEVYKQIIKDLSDAKELLSSTYPDATLLTTTLERVRPALYSLDSLNAVFLKNSNECIWQLQPINTGRNTEDARTFIIPETGLSDLNGDEGHPVSLSDELLNAFEDFDNRKLSGNWVNNIDIGGVTYYYPYKYKSATLDAPVTEYLAVLRLGEQYLIRAEARAQQSKISESQSDLNAIRNRAGLENTNANDKTDLLATILHERQVELFTEWGHRWFDLKRTGNVDEMMSVVTPKKANGDAWQSYQQLYPLPFADIQKAPNLVQNPGY